MATWANLQFNQPRTTSVAATKPLIAPRYSAPTSRFVPLAPRANAPTTFAFPTPARATPVAAPPRAASVPGLSPTPSSSLPPAPVSGGGIWNSWAPRYAVSPVEYEQGQLPAQEVPAEVPALPSVEEAVVEQAAAAVEPAKTGLAGVLAGAGAGFLFGGPLGAVIGGAAIAILGRKKE